MAFVSFMQSWAGRLLRIGAGALMMWYGLTQMVGTGGIARRFHALMWPPADEPWNLRTMHVRHPDGHVFRIGRGIEETDGQVTRAL